MRGDNIVLYNPPLSSSFSISLSLTPVQGCPVEVPAETFPFQCFAVRVTQAYEVAYTINQLLHTQEMIKRPEK
jgi:hypothetical protein